MKRFLLFSTLLLTGCRRDSDYPREVTGTVFSVYTQKPVADVWISARIVKGFINTRSQEIGETLTDRNGAFRLTIPPKDRSLYLTVRSSPLSQGIDWYTTRNEPVNAEALKAPLSISVYTSARFQPNFSNQRPGGRDDELTVVYSYRMQTFPVTAQEVYSGDSLAFRTRRGFWADAETYVKYELRLKRGGQTITRVDSLFLEPGRVNTPRITY
jgi:hypothetical protein